MQAASNRGTRGPKLGSRVQAMLLAVTLSCLVAACGFTPLYDDDFGGPEGSVAAIQIGAIPDRLGQITRNRLVERLGDVESADFRLEVDLETEQLQFGLRGDNRTTGAQADGSVTQEQTTVIARFRLVDLQSGEAVIDDRVVTRASYDLVLSDFAIVTKREDTTRRLALSAVEQIERRLGLYFKAQKDAN